MNKKKLCSVPGCKNEATLAKVTTERVKFYCDDHRKDVQEAKARDKAWKQHLKDDYGIIMEEA